MALHYLILIPITALAVGKVLLQGMISRTYLKIPTDSALYNAIVFGGMSVLYLVFTGFKLPTPHILPYGILYGTLLSGFQVLFTLALQRGPVSHTTLIINFNIGFSVFYGIVYCGESLTLLNIIGIICIFLSLILTIDFEQAKQHKFDLIWFLLSVGATTANGLSSIVLKIQKETYPLEDTGMLLTAYVSGACVMLLTWAYLTYVRKTPKTVLLHPARVRVMLCSSLIMGVHLLLFSKGLEVIPSVVFFPIANIAPATVISVCGFVLFKDHISKQQVFSMIFGIAATTLLCF